MHYPTLPEPRTDCVPAFTDAASAKTWLASLADLESAAALAALLEQIEAIDGAALPAPQTVALLNLVRSAVVPLHAAQAARYTRKPLPMLHDEEQGFAIAQAVWMQLGIAYLRVVPNCTPANRALPLLRAASAFRVDQYCHFLAARTCPAPLDRLLVEVLAAATANDVLRKVVVDPDYPRQGKGSIAGQVAWAFLLRAIDPYHLTAIQLRVANSACGRWRELVSIKSGPVEWQRSYVVDLSALVGNALPAGAPCWLDIRGVARKIGQRIDALKAGESPEALNMGRDLSAAAAIRLLVDLEQHLHPPEPAAPGAPREFDLAFGAEHAYAVLANKALNQAASEVAASPSVYRRMELFGFERIAPKPTEVAKKLQVPSERWTVADGLATRAAQDSASRRLAPCLVATRIEDTPLLGTLSSLRSAADGTLTARLTWHDEDIEAGSLKRLVPLAEKLVRVPVFLLKGYGQQLSLILPPDSGTRLGVAVELADTSLTKLVPVEVLERGADFVRYACRRP